MKELTAETMTNSDDNTSSQGTPGRQETGAPGPSGLIFCPCGAYQVQWGQNSGRGGQGTSVASGLQGNQHGRGSLTSGSSQVHPAGVFGQPQSSLSPLTLQTPASCPLPRPVCVASRQYKVCSLPPASPLPSSPQVLGPRPPHSP